MPSDVLPFSLSLIGAAKEERWHKGFYNVIKPCLMHSPVAISKAQIRLNALFMCFRVQILNFNAFHVLQACNQGLHLMKNKRVTILMYTKVASSNIHFSVFLSFETTHLLLLCLRASYDSDLPSPRNCAGFRPVRIITWVMK